MTLRVFVAAPHEHRDEVESVHGLLLEADLVPVSRWPYGDEYSEEEMTPEQSVLRALHNDSDLAGAHAVLVLARIGSGAEMFADIGRALALQTPVVWTGDRRAVTSYRRGVRYEETVGDAITLLRAMSDVVLRPWPRPVASAREELWRWVCGEREASQELPRRTA